LAGWHLSKLFILEPIELTMFVNAMNPVLLKTKKVVGTEGYILGEINDLQVDFNTWQATAFCVILSDEATAELNLKKPFLRRVMICLPTQLIGSVGDVVTLKEPVRNLTDAAEKELQVKSVKVEGKRVVSPNGFLVGEVEGLDVDFDNWQVNGLQVALTDEAASELGFSRPFMSKVVVIVPSKAIGAVENFVTLDEGMENLKSLVECIRSCQLKK
jgi:sporulation protein YlmC with PRC-barrel domain